MIGNNVRVNTDTTPVLDPPQREVSPGEPRLPRVPPPQRKPASEPVTQPGPFEKPPGIDPGKAPNPKG